MKGSRPLTDNEVRAVCEALGVGPYAKRNQALFLLGIRSGFRISEILSLTLGDVYQGGRMTDRVAVARRHMKKKLEGRTVMLHTEAQAALEAWIVELLKVGPSDPQTFVFRSREGGNVAINRRSAWRVLVAAYAKCGLSGKLGTHTMRKTFAKRIHAKLGKDLIKTQKALGHRNVNSTVSYLSFDEGEIDDAILAD